jgi:Leucine-rich repeat (LRR) protein
MTLRDNGITRLELEEDLFLRSNIASLKNVNLSQNNITKIRQRAFYRLADLQYLNLYSNSITMDSKAFYNNTRLVWLSLSRNSITDLYTSTFQKNVRLNYIDMFANKIISLHPDLFKNNVELASVDVRENRITDIHPSTLEITSGFFILIYQERKLL